MTGTDVDDLNRGWPAAPAVRHDAHVDLLLTGEYFRQNDHSGAVHFLRESFPGVPRLARWARAVTPLTRAISLRKRISAPTPRPTPSPARSGRDLTDALAITNIANYRKFKTSLFQDLDLSAVVDSLDTNGMPTTVQERRIDSEQCSNELQLNYSVPFVEAVGGLFYFHERQRPIDNVGLARRNGMQSNIPILQAAGVDLAEAYALCGYSPDTVTGGDTVIAPKRVCTHSNLGTEAWAVFGQANIGLGLLSDSLDSITVKVGGRFSEKDIEFANPAIVIAAGGRGPVIRSTVESTYRARTFKDFTPEPGITWQPNRDLLVYYTYAEGFKAGSGENAAFSTTIVGPETVRSHEAGVKATLFGNITANLAAYTYNLKGAQLNKTIAGGPTGYQTIFQNAAETTAKGLELDVFGRITPLSGLAARSPTRMPTSRITPRWIRSTRQHPDPGRCALRPGDQPGSDCLWRAERW